MTEEYVDRGIDVEGYEDSDVIPTQKTLTFPKRSREEKNENVAKKLKGEPNTALMVWKESVEKSCGVAELRKLCAANHLMVSGTKQELLLRLVKCRLHGSPGTCCVCRNPKLECLYANDDVTTLPYAVTCKHMKAKSERCAFGTRRPESFDPFVDTECAVLARRTI